MSEYLNVGKIVNTHGLQGETKILAITDFPEKRFKKNNTLFMASADGTIIQSVVIETVRPHKNCYLIKFKEFSHINEVEKYKGTMLKVKKDEKIDLPKDEYYFHDILGCEVVSEEGEQLGKITEILKPGANDVWVVQGSAKKPILIPFIDLVVKEIDIKNKKIIIHMMEGLV